MVVRELTRVDDARRAVDRSLSNVVSPCSLKTRAVSDRPNDFRNPPTNASARRVDVVEFDLQHFVRNRRRLAEHALPEVGDRISGLVTRSIRGHQTEAMQHHYSTVNADEQRAALAKVISLVDRLPAPTSAASGGGRQRGSRGGRSASWGASWRAWSDRGEETTKAG